MAEVNLRSWPEISQANGLQHYPTNAMLEQILATMARLESKLDERDRRLGTTIPPPRPDAEPPDAPPLYSAEQPRFQSTCEQPCNTADQPPRQTFAPLEQYVQPMRVPHNTPQPDVPQPYFPNQPLPQTSDPPYGIHHQWQTDIPKELPTAAVPVTIPSLPYHTGSGFGRQPEFLLPRFSAVGSSEFAAPFFTTTCNVHLLHSSHHTPSYTQQDGNLNSYLGFSHPPQQFGNMPYRMTTAWDLPETHIVPEPQAVRQTSCWDDPVLRSHQGYHSYEQPTTVQQPLPQRSPFCGNPPSGHCSPTAPLAAATAPNSVKSPYQEFRHKYGNLKVQLEQKDQDLMKSVKKPEEEKLILQSESESSPRVDGDKDKDDGRGKLVKVNKEEDDQMRATIAKVVVRTATKVCDITSRWQLMGINPSITEAKLDDTAKITNRLIGFKENHKFLKDGVGNWLRGSYFHYHYVFDPGGEIPHQSFGFQFSSLLRGSHLEDKVNFNRGRVDTSISTLISPYLYYLVYQ